ncbi:hypothetical protein MRX96_033256 [Rhipicephalus microplus]
MNCLSVALHPFCILADQKSVAGFQKLGFYQPGYQSTKRGSALRRTPSAPERAQFLALYGSGETAADGKSSKNELSPVLTSPTFPSLEELRREFDAYIEKKCASLDKFVLDFCAESVVPLLESTTCPDKEYAAVVQAFYGIICNKGRRLPAFVKPDQ